jgi:hypothetical protein
MSENKTAKTPTDSGVGFIDGVWYGLEPKKKEWVGLTDEEINSVRYKRDWTAPWTDVTFARAIEAKLREKNHG